MEEMKANIINHPTHPGHYYLEYRPNGSKGKREREPFDTYNAAYVRKQELERSHKLETPVVHPRLKDVYEEYLSWVDDNLAMASRENKRRRIVKHIIPGLGQYRVRELSQTIFDTYGKGMAKGSYLTDIYCIMAMITWMVKRKYAVALDWKPERPEYHRPVKNIPAPEDILIFIDHIPKENQRVLFSMMLYTGLRWHEATYLRWEDYRTDRLRLSTTKTKVPQTIYIPGELQPWFKDNQKKEGWIFTAWGRAPYKNLQHVLSNIYKETGIKMTPHLFRHASATLLYQMDNDLYAVKQHLRHSRITTSEIYTRYSIERSRKATSDLFLHINTYKKVDNLKTD
jgi:integrase